MTILGSGGVCDAREADCQALGHWDEADSAQLAATLAERLKETRPLRHHRPPPTWAELALAYRQRIEALARGSNHSQ